MFQVELGMHLKIPPARGHIVSFSCGRQTVPAVLSQVEVNSGKNNLSIFDKRNTAQQFCDGLG